MEFIITAFIAPFFLSAIANDFSATKDCRKRLFDVKKKFEILRDHILSIDRNEQITRDLLNTCKSSLESLYAEKSGMLATWQLGTTIIDSFRLFDLLRQKNNPAHAPNSIAVDLLQVWGLLDLYTFEKSNFAKIQILLHRSLPGRMVDPLRYIAVCLRGLNSI
jgi:hypothetical protein